ncbi:hypothetical protein NIES4102_03980 [Chondrocystis sp. NIES-4102]|nr:hypothetical protein NIES4102_03980 [Chondrocystis sp. NIES-4102]
MRTIQTQVNIKSDRAVLNIQLPEDIEMGEYQVVIVMNPQKKTTVISLKHNINQLAGKITAFKNIDAVAWQQEIREEWDKTK